MIVREWEKWQYELCPSPQTLNSCLVGLHDDLKGGPQRLEAAQFSQPPLCNYILDTPTLSITVLYRLCVTTFFNFQNTFLYCVHSDSAGTVWITTVVWMMSIIIIEVVWL